MTFKLLEKGPSIAWINLSNFDQITYAQTESGEWWIVGVVDTQLPPTIEIDGPFGTEKAARTALETFIE